MNKKYLLLIVLIMAFSLKGISVYAVEFTFYRTLTLINNNSFDLIDYQIPIIINYTYQQPDFSDIRFTNSTYSNSDNWTLNYSYYIENKINSNWAKVWFKIDNILANSNKTIYLRYGNNSPISNLSNGYNTFILFEDFENNSKQNWTSRTATCTIINNNSAYLGNYFLEGIPTYSGNGCSRDYQINLTHYIVHIASKSYGDSLYGSICEGSSCLNNKFIYAQHKQSNLWYLYNQTSATSIGSYNGLWNEYNIYKNDSNFINISIFNLSQNLLNATWVNGSHVTTNQPTFYYTGYSDSFWLDNFWVRNWNNNIEPTYILGNELTGNITIPTNLASIRCLDNQTLYREKVYTICSGSDCSTQNISSSEICQNGCDNVTSSCTPAEYLTSLYLFIIILIVIGSVLWLRKRL